MSASTVIQDAAAIATAGGFITAAGAIVQAKRVSRAQNFFTLAQFLQDPEVRKARRRIFDAKDLEALPTQWLAPDAGKEQGEIVQAAGLVASSYDLTGRVVELGYVDHQPFLDDWGPSIKKAFETLEPFVKERRKQHDNDRYFDNFEELAASVISWEDSRLLPWWRRRPLAAFSVFIHLATESDGSDCIAHELVLVSADRLLNIVEASFS